MFGAFGAGVSLAIAASVALLVVSSVVAFRGWPGDATAPRNPEDDQLSATRAEAKHAAAISEIVSLPKAVVHRAAHATTDETAAAHTDAATAQSQSAATGESSSQASQASSSSEASSTQGPSRGASSNIVKPVTDTVRDTTKAVADT